MYQTPLSWDANDKVDIVLSHFLLLINAEKSRSPCKLIDFLAGWHWHASLCRELIGTSKGREWASSSILFTLGVFLFDHTSSRSLVNAFVLLSFIPYLRSIIVNFSSVDSPPRPTARPLRKSSCQLVFSPIVASSHRHIIAPANSSEVL
ncbi:hypothetical protein VTH06DRAFT_4686 [Thermothelomyces fergusii]